MSFLTNLLIRLVSLTAPPPPLRAGCSRFESDSREEASTSHLWRIEGGRQEERGLMEGREVVGGETARGEGGVKEQEGFVKKVGEECWGKGQSREREDGGVRKARE